MATAIQYSQPVPLRLAYHTLVHHLIRQGLTKKATTLCLSMIKNRIPVRPSTLTILIRLLPTVPSSGDVPALQPPKRSELLIEHITTLFTPKVLQFALKESITPDRPHTKGMKQAVAIMEYAQIHGQNRSFNMWNSLITSCILHTEIILAALIFAALIKGLEAAIEGVLPSERRGGHLAEEPYSPTLHGRRRRRPVRRMAADFPYPIYLIPILNSIDAILADPASDSRLRISALQALAKFAELLDNRQLPFSQLAPLIRSLAKCPKGKDQVWIEGTNEQPQHVNAHQYFTGVLTRLIMDPPKGAPRPRVADGGHIIQPCLDTHSINALLHFALSIRRNVPLANQLMASKQQWKPTVVTYNTLISAGSQLHRPDISANALNALARLEQLDASRDQGLVHALILDYAAVGPVQKTEPSHWLLKNAVEPLMIPPPDGFVEASTISPPQNAVQSGNYIAHEDLSASDIPDLAPLDSVDLLADHYTISATLTHIISAGQPSLVQAVIFRLIPEMDITQANSSDWNTQSYEIVVRRLTSLGPYFFSAALNALRKSRATALLHRIWRWARRAESASWDTGPGGYNEGGKPWCLPIHCYTTMMQAYASELRMPARQDDWARARRRTIAEKGVEPMYWEVFNHAMTVYDQLQDWKTRTDEGLQDKLTIPIPDEKFFNVAIEVFAYDPRLRVRRRESQHRKRKHYNQSHWLRLVQWKLNLYARHGLKSRRDERLTRLSDDIHAAGHKIPVALMHLLVDHLRPRQLKRERVSRKQWKLMKAGVIKEVPMRNNVSWRYLKQERKNLLRRKLPPIVK